MNRLRSGIPLALLLVYGMLFASQALGLRTLFIYDDHPGQYLRLWHGVSHTLLPWGWNPDWWAGYPELQFYPPGYVWLGGLLHLFTLGWVSPERIYQLLLWIIYLLPGLTTFWLFARIFSPWIAFPVAFVALTLSATLRSGVDEGLRWGMIAARLSLGLFPLLALSLTPQRASTWPRWAPFILAAIVLTHPAHAPAGVLLLLIALWPWSKKWKTLLAVLLLAIGLTAIWILPLLAHLSFSLPLAWKEFSISEWLLTLGTTPLWIGALAFWLVGGWLFLRDGSPRLGAALLILPLFMFLTLLIDGVLFETRGILWLPADRVSDSVYFSLLLAGGVGWGAVAGHLRRSLRLPAWLLSLVITGIVIMLPSGPRESTLTLWPRPEGWPKADSAMSALGLEPLWSELRSAPPGRILFIRSAVTLEEGHSHILALAPLMTGREIINGTFTHPSPIAGAFYTGSATSPIRQLVETLDGRMLFGEPIERLDRDRFDRWAERLRISAVVGDARDSGRLLFIEGNGQYAVRDKDDRFVIFFRREGWSDLLRIGPDHYRLSHTSSTAEWVNTGLLAYPLWEAIGPEGPLPKRESPERLLEIFIPSGRELSVSLNYRAGLIEWVGTGVTLVSFAICGAGVLLKRRAMNVKGRFGSRQEGVLAAPG